MANAGHDAGMKSNLTATRYSTRTGKIARLPQTIRQQLNERLADGEPHQSLVAWLNDHGHVQDRLREFFDELRPITEQNLSDWRQGGFLDWQRHQESRGLVREFLCETEELEEEVGESALLDRLTGSVAVVLLRLCPRSRHRRQRARSNGRPCWRSPANWPACRRGDR